MTDDEAIKDAEENASVHRFKPPVYIQRYELVSDLLEDPRWKNKILKVVDFGCAELQFFKFIKNLSEVTSILEVDYNKLLLEQYCTRAEPLVFNYLCSRSKKLNVSVLHGSVCDPDYRLIGCDAVVCIELIEHLDPGALDRLPHNIFGFIEPLLVIITTPNADFNVFFPQLKNGGFRHYDHRFEWTRAQFEDWASNVIARYPNYAVEYIGIGSGPEETKELGCCSQMALFVHKNYNKKCDIELDENENEQTSVDEICLDIKNVFESNIGSKVKWDNINWNDFKKPNKLYGVVAEYQYPFKVDNRTRDEKNTDDAISRIHMYTSYYCPFYNDETYCWEIPLNNLILFNEDLNIDLDLLGENLKLRGYNIVNNHLIYEDKKDDSDQELNDEQPELPNVLLNDASLLAEECWD
ncbi:hen1 methyltransferase [Arctopsyche grandis]|uniref:hen1 methyltransferase n=1 Tax=Arctopsyche grandis TaxID=121162 RepID=UPI00406D74AC